MSQENVQIVRRIWDIYMLGLEQEDNGALAAPYDQGLVAVDSTLSPVSDIPGLKDVYVGFDEFVAFSRSWMEDWQGLTMRLVEVVDAGDDRVLVIVHQSATGKASGAAVELDFGIVYTFEGGRVVDRKDYWVDDARNAAGDTTAEADEVVFGTLNFDGGGQAPGPISAGAVLSILGVEPIERGQAWAEGTNNQAEYRALILAVELAHETGVTHLEVYGDSKLVVEQVNGNWRVKDDDLRALHASALALLDGFAEWKLAHVGREDNARADHVGRQALEDSPPPRRSRRPASARPRRREG